MAQRFIVATGSWDGTNTAIWSATSGGAPGASVPTSADDVFMNAASGAVTVTIAAGNTGCLSLNCTGFTGTLAGSAAISVSGSLTLAGTVTYTGTITMASVAAGNTITTGGKTINTLTLNGVGGVWTLQDAMTVSNNLTVTNGTLDTNGQTVNPNAVIVSNTSTITFGASSVTCPGGFNFAPGVTVNAGTSTLTINNSFGTSFSGSGKTFNNVVFNKSGGTLSVTGANTYANLTVSGTVAGITLTFGANQTVTGTLTTTGISAPLRHFITSDVVGTPRTITAAVVSIADVDFQDIAGAGAASPFTGTRIGDCKGNSGITFTAGANKFWVGNTANWTSTSWALTTGGAAAANNYPLPQDTCILDANSFSANGQTLTINGSFRIGALLCSGTDQTFNIANASNVPIFFGDVTLDGNVSMTAGGTYQFQGRATPQTITSSGRSWDSSITIDSFGGTVTLADALTNGTARTITLTRGTFNMNGKAVSTGLFSSNNANTRSITSGGATLTLTGNAATIWNATTLTNFSLNDALQVNCTYSGATGTRVFNHGGALATPANTPSVKVSAGTDTFSNSGGANFNDLDFTGFSGTWGPVGSAQSFILGSLTLSATLTMGNAGANVYTFGATSGVKTITSAGKTMDFPVTFNGVGGTWQLADAMTVGSSRTTTLTNGTLDVNGQTLTTGLFASANANVRTIKSTLAGGVIATTSTSATTVWDASVATNLTVDRATGSWEIQIGGNTATSRTLNGGGKTWPTLRFTNTTANGELKFAGSNTFKSIAVSTPPQSISFTAGITTTIEDDNGFPSGTPGNLVTIGSVTAANHSLAKSGGGSVVCDYVSVSRSQASPATTWFATNSTNGGNNTGWVFTILMTASAGAFVLAGQDAAFKFGDRVIANTGAFVLSGQAAGFLRGYRLTAAKGAFALNGSAVPGLPYVHASWEARGRSIRVPAPAVVRIGDERRVIKVTA